MLIRRDSSELITPETSSMPVDFSHTHLLQVPWSLVDQSHVSQEPGGEVVVGLWVESFGMIFYVF